LSVRKALAKSGHVESVRHPINLSLGEDLLRPLGLVKNLVVGAAHFCKVTVGSEIIFVFGNTFCVSVYLLCITVEHSNNSKGFETKCDLN
jgi:hypothetical protein